jgi:very-short-patch-repair endonuclease
MDVTVPLRNSRHRPGIRIHRVSKLAKADVGHMRGMRVTTPARTVCDIAGSEHSHDAERALAEARIQRLLTDEDILGAIGRMGTRRGAALARQLLAHSDPGYTRSAAERRLLHLLRAAELPLPRTNFPLHGFSVDFFWPDQRLVVEVDGHQFHAHRSAFESDRRRDQVLVAAGYRVIRITWRQLKRQPLAVIARIAQALRAERAA